MTYSNTYNDLIITENNVIITGTVNGILTINSNASAELNGIVNGTISGVGKIIINGIVNGKITNPNAIISPGAIINSL